jgi:chromosomal replication initiation ATPase DnaA
MDGGIAFSPSVKSLARQVAERHGLSVEELTGPCRRKHLVRARHELFFLAFDRHNLSKLSAVLMKDRQTIRHGIKRHKARILNAQSVSEERGRDVKELGKGLVALKSRQS